MNVAFLVLFIAAVVFSTVCVVRFLEALRESREESDAIERWWAERSRYRTTSSIEDDSPETDSGPKAA